MQDNVRNPERGEIKQSVCKHCGEKIFHEAGVWWSKSPSGLTSYAACQDGKIEVVSHEPVAEPASTGEPRESLSVQKRKHYMKGGHAADFVPAARPSEPSAPPLVELPGPTGEGSSGHSWVEPAPQTSAELPQPLPCRTPGAVYHFKLAHSEQSGREILTLHVYMPQEISIAEEQAQAIEEKLHDACEAILSAYWPNNFHAAPQPVPRADPEHPIVGPEDGFPCCEHCAKHPGSQWTLKVSHPVSGDAPKVESACSCNPKPLNGQHWTGCQEGKVEEIAERIAQAVTCTHEGCKTIDILRCNIKRLSEAILRPYFPPASQTPKSLDFHTWITRVHGFKVGSARNSYKEADLEAAWNAGISHRPEVIGAKPLCLDCHGAGIVNCSHFDNCSGKWVYVATPASTARTGAHKGDVMHIELKKYDLYLHGLATDHIWLMADGPDSHPIGIRLDCGDSGTVYLSRSQAKDLAEQLHELAAPGSVPQAASGWTVDEAENFKRLASEPQPKPTEHLIRAMGVPQAVESDVQLLINRRSNDEGELRHAWLTKHEHASSISFDQETGVPHHAIYEYPMSSIAQKETNRAFFGAVQHVRDQDTGVPQAEPPKEEKP